MADTPREAIKKIIDQTYLANKNRDWKGATAYMAADYYLIDLKGNRVTRAARVKAVQKFFHDADSFKVSQNSNLVGLAKNAAQTEMTYTMDIKMRLQGQIYRQTSRLHEKSWWQLRKAGWKVTHSQILSGEYMDPKGKWIPYPK